MEKYRQFLVDTQIKLSENYDKLVITLSGGALALSITFLKDIIGNKNISHPELLLLSWALFVISLAGILCSILFGIKAYKKAISQVDGNTINNEKIGGNSSICSLISHWLAAICLLIGLGLISIFAYCNIG